jgi:hypothetical protein
MRFSFPHLWKTQETYYSFFLFNLQSRLGAFLINQPTNFYTLLVLVFVDMRTLANKPQ